MRKIAYILTILLFSCQKESCNELNGKWKIVKVVNNQTGYSFTYPNDSMLIYDINNSSVDVSLRYKGVDSFMYKREMDCNKVFFKSETSFQLGLLWDYIYAVRV